MKHDCCSVYAQSSSIQFKISEDHPQNQSRNSSVITGTSATTKRTYQKKALKSSVSSSGKIDYHKIGSFENKANILGTKSSLEILKEKGAVKRTEIKKSTSESMEKEHNTRPTEKDKSIIICKETEEEIFTNLRKPSYESLRLLTNNKPEAVRQPSKCNEGKCYSGIFGPHAAIGTILQVPLFITLFSWKRKIH